MLEERVYHEYASWKLEHHDLIEKMKTSKSNLILRFEHVLEVVDHLYDKMVDTLSYTEEELNIFETGFFYAADQIDEIKNLLEKTYANNLAELEKRSKDVNLLLSTLDFQNEILGVDSYDEKDLEKLMDFEKEVLNYLENKQEVPETMFHSLDQISLAIFKKMNVSFYPINDVFLEIADELGIIV
jgi:hypothetical protein